MALDNSVWNLTVPAISPMYTYSSFTGDSATGWATTCTDGDVYACDESTSHVTSAAVSVSLTFEGSGIAFYGNATNSMSITLSIDGGSASAGTIDASSQLLATAQSLQTGNHTAILTAVPSSPAALLSFAQSIISVNTGIANAQPDITYVDDLSPGVSYGPYWFQYNNYQGETQDGNGTFHAANAYNTSASLRFNASAVLLYGPCYAATGLFAVDVTPGPGTTTLNTTASGPQVGAHVFQNCLRYFATNLDPTVERVITMTNIENGTYATLDYIELIRFSGTGPAQGGGSSGNSGTTGGGGASGGTTSGGNSTSSGGPNVGAIVGGVVGGVGGLLVLLLLFFLWRRHQRNSRTRAEPFRPRVSLDTDTEAAKDGAVSPALATGSTDPPALSSNDLASPAGDRTESAILSPITPGGATQMSQKQLLMAQYAAAQRRAQHAPSTLSAPDSSVEPPSSAAASGGTPSAPSSASDGLRTAALAPAAPAFSQSSPLVHPSPTTTAILSPAFATSKSSAPPNPLDLDPPSLSQISNDVNRIIAQLSRLGRAPAPGGTGEEEWDDELLEGVEEGDLALVEGTAPPSYDVSHGGNHY